MVIPGYINIEVDCCDVCKFAAVMSRDNDLVCTNPSNVANAGNGCVISVAMFGWCPMFKSVTASPSHDDRPASEVALHRIDIDAEVLEAQLRRLAALTQRSNDNQSLEESG